MDMELKTALDDLHSTWEEFKATHSQQEDELRKHGVAITETETKLERIQESLDTFEKAVAQLSRPDGTKDDDEATQERAARRKAFDVYLRNGLDGMEPESVKSLVVSDDTEGGYLAPDEMVSEIIKGIQEFSPIREVARVRSTSRRSIKAPKRTQVAGAVWVGEVDTRLETQNPALGMEEISTRELSAMADVSRQDLEDAAFSIEDWLNEEFSEQFGISEGAAFVSGDGVDGKPEGFLTAADTGYLGNQGIKTLTSNTNDALNADDFIDLFYELKEGYARNASFIMHRSTIKAARKLKDSGTPGQYLWQPGLAGLAPATILDRPYIEAKDMPVVANGALAVAFGDWRRGYWIVDRLAIETMRDPYTQAGTGMVRFWARKRVGGQVVLPEAIKLLKIQ